MFKKLFSVGCLKGKFMELGFVEKKNIKSFCRENSSNWVLRKNERKKIDCFHGKWCCCRKKEKKLGKKKRKKLLFS